MKHPNMQAEMRPLPSTQENTALKTVEELVAAMTILQTNSLPIRRGYTR